MRLEEHVKHNPKAQARNAWGWGFPRWNWQRYGVPYAVLALVHIVTALIFLLDEAPGTNAAITGFPLDDSWIHLVYSRALAGFEGFAYNPGQPETGATSPLWAVLLAPLFWIKWLWGGSIVFGVKVFGITVAWWASAVAWRLAHRLTGYQAAGYVAGLMIALDPFVAFAKLSGMEVLLFGGLVLYLVWSLVERRYAAIVLSMALLPLARPEGMVAWGMGAGCLVWILALHVRRWWAWPLALLPSVLTVGAWVGYCYSLTGRPLPATYYAKQRRRSGLWDEANANVLQDMLGDIPWLYLYVGVALAVVGVILILARRPGTEPGWRSFDQWVTRLGLVLYAPVFIYALSLSHILLQHWPFYWNRYFQPVLPMLYIPIAVAVGTLMTLAWRRLRDPESSWPLRIIPGLLVVALIVPSGIGLVRQTQRLGDLYANNCQNINEMNVALGKWVNANVPEGTWIALNDAGAIRFWSERPAVDLLGLNNHRSLFGEKAQVLKEADPQYFVIFTDWFNKRYKNSKRYTLETQVEVAHYSICDCGSQNSKAVYRKLSKEEYTKQARERMRERAREKRKRRDEARKKRAKKSKAVGKDPAQKPIEDPGARLKELLHKAKLPKKAPKPKPDKPHP